MQRGIKLTEADMADLREIYSKMSKSEKAAVKPLWASATEEFSPLAIIRILIKERKGNSK